MAEQGLILRGLQGLVKGHVWFCPAGADGVLGRSRRCSMCLKDAPGYIAATSKQKKEEQLFRTASRQHVAIQVSPEGAIRLRDTSSNGTFLNAERFTEKALTAADLQKSEVLLRVGTTETFRLEWGPRPADQNATAEHV